MEALVLYHQHWKYERKLPIFMIIAKSNLRNTASVQLWWSKQWAAPEKLYFLLFANQQYWHLNWARNRTVSLPSHYRPHSAGVQPRPTILWVTLSPSGVFTSSVVGWPQVTSVICSRPLFSCPSHCNFVFLS